MPCPALLALGSSPAFEVLMMTLAGGALVTGLVLGARQRALTGRHDPWRWRWLLWPQLGLVLAVTLVAYTGAFAGGRVPLLRVPGMDKTLHFLCFGSLALGTWFASRGRTVPLGPVRVPMAVLVPLLLAVAEELVQAASPHRSADPLDLLADLLGLLVFWRLGLRLSPAALEHGKGRHQRGQ